MCKSIRALALVLVCVMMLGLVACGETPAPTTTAEPTEAPTNAPTAAPTAAPTEPQLSYAEQIAAFMTEKAAATAPGLNTYESSWEDMVAYLTEKGVIAADAAQVDMLTTPGYLKMYDGSFNDVYNFADKAVDFGGLWLCWWNLAEPTSAYDCYVGMQQNSGNIVVMGGMYVVNAVATPYGSFAIAFAEGYDETAKAAALAAMDAVDGTAYSLKYMGGTTDLAMAMMQAGLLAATDIAAAADLNAAYTYDCMRQDWVGYEQSPETGYGEPYQTTNYAYVASQAYSFGKISILYFAAGDIAETSWYPYYVSIYNQIVEKGTLTPYTRPGTDWTYAPYTVDANGAYSAEGTNLEIPVDGVYGNFVIIINE